MSLVYKDRVSETSTTTGDVDPYVLLGAVAGFQTFAAIGDTNICGYCATDDTDWEVGIGTYDLATTSLARTIILASSNAGAAVNWGAGTRTVFCTVPSTMLPLLNLAVANNGNTIESDSGHAVLVGGRNNTVGGGGNHYGIVVGGYGNIASGESAIAVGGQGNTASGYYSVVSGGSSNTASSAHSVVSGGQNNTASSNHSVVSGGQGNQAITGPHATVGGGKTNTASGVYSVVAGGYTCTSSAAEAVVGGGYNNGASGVYSTISGGRDATTRGIYGMSAIASGKFSVQGDAQEGGYRLRASTTDATPTIATADAGAASATNQPTLPNNSAYAFRVLVIAHRTDVVGTRAVYSFVGGISRDANAASTAILTVTKTVVHEDDAAYDCNVVSDTTNGALSVEVTGKAAHTVQWVAKVETIETVGG